MNSSLDFPGDSPGDGTGTFSAATTVKTARQAGILWIESAGNGRRHWGGTFTDPDQDGFVDIGGVYNPSVNAFEDDVMFVGPGSPSQPAQAVATLRWTQWQPASQGIYLLLYGYQCTTAFAQQRLQRRRHQSRWQRLSDSPGSRRSAGVPIESIPLTNTSQFDQYYQVSSSTSVANPSGPTYDLFYDGDIDGPSELAWLSRRQQPLHHRGPGLHGSITEPASSPYALAVGAVDSGADGDGQVLEQFSSQGPTVDGRIKPDIASFDGVSSYLSDFNTGFYGTSASAPHVTGAAALALAAHPGLTADQLAAYLTTIANHGAPVAPTNQQGSGLMTCSD